MTKQELVKNIRVELEKVYDEVGDIEVLTNFTIAEIKRINKEYFQNYIDSCNLVLIRNKVYYILEVYNVEGELDFNLETLKDYCYKHDTDKEEFAEGIKLIKKYYNL